MRSAAQPLFGNKWYILIVVSLGYLNAQWAMPPISSILPTIGRDLGLSVPETGWIMSCYFLMLVGTVLLMGKLGDRLGHKTIFVGGMVVFVVANLAAGLSQSFPALVTARAVQGVGSAMIFGTSLAIIITNFPPHQRGTAVGLMTMIASAGALLGTYLATWSVQHLSWQWGFLFLVPISLVTLVGGLGLRLPRVTEKRPVDWLGGALLFGAILFFMLGLNHLHEGEETFESGAPYHLGMHLLALGFFAAFIYAERQVAAPLLSFRLLRDPTFASGVSTNGIAHMSMLATSLLIPFLLERGRGLTPADTGLLLMAQMISMTTCSLLMGWLYGRTRSPLISVGTMVGMASGLLTMGLVGGTLPFSALMLVVIVLGGCLGGFTTVNNTAVMGMASVEQRGFASGLVELTRQLGHGVGSSVSASLLGAALAGVASPSYSDYANGFQYAALTMGTIAVLGVVIIVWPVAREAQRRQRAEALSAPPEATSAA